MTVGSGAPLGPGASVGAAVVALDERKPLQRPLLQELKAQSASDLQEALKLPHRRISIALLAQHSEVPTHCSVVAHSSPSLRVPGAAVTVGSGAPLAP